MSSRVNKLVRSLKDDLEELVPGATYQSYQTTLGKKRGMFTGYDLGDFGKVGVFRAHSSNLGKVYSNVSDKDLEQEIMLVFQSYGLYR